MTFASDAQRRWYFANLAAAGSVGGSSTGAGSSSVSGASPDAGGGFTSSVLPSDKTRALEVGYAEYMAHPDRQLERVQYAQAMFPNHSEADALRELNDREGISKAR